MRGIKQMIFDQTGARSAFQKYLVENFRYQESPLVKSVRMTRGGKFIVEVEDEQTYSATKKAAAAINPKEREEVCSQTSTEDGAHRISLEKTNLLHKGGILFSEKIKSPIGNL